MGLSDAGAAAAAAPRAEPSALRAAEPSCVGTHKHSPVETDTERRVVSDVFPLACATHRMVVQTRAMPAAASALSNAARARRSASLQDVCQ